tara:strand:+ start:746 stop:1099 length:354 start_codon:yes stop_codon:yes gene_type:complete
MNYSLIKTVMKKINLKLLSFFMIIFFSLTSCQSIKDGLSGRKSENSDEFLVQKKNPLVMPPDFMKLPKPDDISKMEESSIEKQTDIKNILNLEKSENKLSESKFGNAEEFVLENIKN